MPKWKEPQHSGHRPSQSGKSVSFFHQSRNVQVANVSGEGNSQDDRLLVVTGERSRQIECSGLKADKARQIMISSEVEPGEVVIK